MKLKLLLVSTLLCNLLIFSNSYSAGSGDENNFEKDTTIEEYNIPTDNEFINIFDTLFSDIEIEDVEFNPKIKDSFFDTYEEEYPLTELENNFYFVTEENTKNKVTHQDICHSFLQCINDDFASYLSIKKKLIYINALKLNEFNALKEKIAACDNFSHVSYDDFIWHGYLLSFINFNIFYKTQSYKDILLQYDLKIQSHRDDIITKMQTTHPSTLFLCELLAFCPEYSFMQNDETLKCTYPSFYNDYMLQKNNISSQAIQIEQIAKKRYNKTTLKELLEYIVDLIAIYPITNNMDNIAWDALTTQLKTFWDPKDEKTFGGLYMGLSNLSKKQDLEKNLKEPVKNLKMAARRLCRKNNSLTNITTEQKELLEQITTVLKENPSNIKNNEYWEGLTTKLKTFWDPQGKMTFGGLYFVLLKLSKKQDLEEHLKEPVENLKNAAKRLYIKNKSLTNITTEQKELLENITNILKENISNIKDNKYWEVLITQLKTFWDPKDKKTFEGLYTTLLTLSKKEDLEEKFKESVKNLKNAARRLCRKNNSLTNITAEQKELLEQITTILKENPSNIKDNKYWEGLTTKLKTFWDPIGEKTFGGLYSVLSNHSKKEDLEKNLKEPVENLKNAAKRLYNRLKKPKPKTKLKDQTNLVNDTLEPVNSNNIINDDDISFVEIEKNVELDDFIMNEFINEDGEFTNNEQLNFDNLEAVLIHQESSNNNKTAGNDLLNLVKTLIRNNPIPNNIDKKPCNKAWETLTKQLKIFWDSKGKKTFGGLKIALKRLSKKKQLEENFKKLVKNLENAAERLYIEKNSKTDLNDNQKELLKQITTILKENPSNIKNDEYWEALTTKLKTFWDPIGEKTFGGLYAVLLTLSKKQDLEEKFKEPVKNLANAADRLYKRLKKPKPKTKLKDQTNVVNDTLEPVNSNNIINDDDISFVEIEKNVELDDFIMNEFINEDGEFTNNEQLNFDNLEAVLIHQESS
ncbi:MAG: hypothetical protein Q8L85_09790 [Alphaproteobacteria bacterium]|nr:hypothetical protein [Alphaproteobacteria bacterium]